LRERRGRKKPIVLKEEKVPREKSYERGGGGPREGEFAIKKQN